MIQSLLGGVAVPWVHLQKVPDQVLGIIGNVLPVRRIEGEIAQANLRQHLGVCLTKERRVSTEHDVHDDTNTPAITQLVVLPGQYLWCNVVWGSRFGVQHLVLLKPTRQTEINDLQQGLLDGLLRQEEKVLRLQVPVADMILVHVVDRSHNLLHQDGCLDFGKMAGLNDPVEQLTATAKLHDQVDAAMVLKGLIQLDDVRVVQQLHDGNLLFEAVDVLHLGLRNRLHSSDGVSPLAFPLAHGAVGALAQLPFVEVIRLENLPGVVHNEVAMAKASSLDIFFRNIGGLLAIGSRPVLVLVLFLTGTSAHSCSTQCSRRAIHLGYRTPVVEMS
mmetsp:Transcript_7809/g.21330  ORF Transcript_7809/g.21330 Transcript_7809/m.21330 type:complete len:331 (+) Transcript_7809:626-1618(+)